MAHEIETHGDQAAAIYAREDAWHRLGTTLPDTFTAEEAMTTGHLGGWDVRKIPVTATEIGPNGVYSLPVPGQYATVRTSPWTGEPEVLGTAGEDYRPIQNEDHCELLNALVEESGAHFDTAGSLRGGKEVFVTLRLPDHMMVGGVDRVDLNIAALNYHYAGRSFRLMVTPVRVVCANTQAAALRDNIGMYSTRHTGDPRQALTAARENLSLCFKYIGEFQSEAERMINATMTEAEFDKIIRENYGPTEDMPKRAQTNAEKVIGELSALFNCADTQADIRGTHWAAYQAVTEYVDHSIPVRGPQGADTAAVRAERVLTAPDLVRIKTDAFDLFRIPA